MNRRKSPNRNKKKADAIKQLERPSNHKPNFREKAAKIKKWFWQKRTQVAISGIVVPIIAIIVSVILKSTDNRPPISADNRAYISIVDPFFDNPYIFAGQAGWKLEATYSIVCNDQAYEVRDSSYVEVLPKNTKLVMPNSVDMSRQLICSPDSPQMRTVQSASVLRSRSQSA